MPTNVEPDRRSTCGLECSCPSRLHHDIVELVFRMEIEPGMSYSKTLDELRSMLLEDSDDA